MSSLPVVALSQPDWRLAIISLLVGCGAAFAALWAWEHAAGQRAMGRRVWRIGAAFIASTGIWASHFLAVRAYEWGASRPYMPAVFAFALTVATLVVARSLTSARPRRVRVDGNEPGAGESRRRPEPLPPRPAADLKDENGLLDMALTSLPHALSMVDADRRLIMCNKRFAEMYGLPQELTKPGTPVDVLVEHRIASGIYGSTDPNVIRGDACRPLTKTTVKTRHLTGGRVILVTRRPTPNGGWVAIHEDITERRRLQEMEREAKDTLKAVFDTVPAAIVCLSPDRRVMLWSRGAEHIFGYTAEETVGQPYKLVPPKGKTKFEALFERAMAGDILREIYVRRRRKDGSLVDVSFSCASMRDRDGEVRGVVYALDDISEREKLAARLKEQHELLMEREEKLKVQNDQLDAALANMMQGLAMYDSEERLVLANARYAELFGLTQDEVKPGTTLREIVKRRAARGLYPGRTVGEILKNVRQQISQGTGSYIVDPGNGRFLSASIRPRSKRGWVVTVNDITEQGQLKQQLEARNEQLDVALNNMSQGLAMFDSDQRLVVCNRNYAEMYGLTLDDVRPGTTVRQTLESRLKRELYEAPSVVEELHARFGQRPSDIHRLTDGRTIHVTYRRTSNGGLVVTHEDITEREKLNARLEEQHELLKSQEEKLRGQNVVLDAALNNMMQGLVLLDPDLRIMVANARFMELYKLRPEQVRPGTPLRDLLEHILMIGELPGKTVDGLVQAVRGLISTGIEEQNTYTTKDGRFIVACTKPMSDGSLVITHHDITEQRRSEAKIVHMALHDALTDLPNRVLFNTRLEQALSHSTCGSSVAVHLLDLDHFKNVNDTLGHQAGDTLLRAAATRLRNAVREGDVVARMGGDEFAILQRIDQPSDAAVLAHRVIQTVIEPYEIDGQLAVIGTSIGIAIGGTDNDNPDRLIRNADLALYRAKDDGRGAFRFFEAGMDAKIQHRHTMEQDLRKALLGGELELYYQPIVNIRTNQICACEALLRWRHPEKGLILPSAFIPVAEKIGFIVPLGEWVLRRACAAAARWPAQIRLDVNISPNQFRSSGLVETVISALAASGLAPERLQLEITEAALLHDVEAVIASLYQLKEIGVSIAIDDFGTGYSSLGYLQSFPFERIKIDRSFVKDVADDIGSVSIVRAVAALANGLGMETTAEGVETELQRQALAAEGCTEMQGFLFSEPRPSAEIETLLRHQWREVKPEEPTGGKPSIAARAAGR